MNPLFLLSVAWLLSATVYLPFVNGTQPAPDLTPGLVAAGNLHTCALSQGGEVKCWGGNLFGQLGTGSTADSLTPVTVNGLDGGVKAVAAGGYHTCALTSAGGVKCWGLNQFGQLGDGSHKQRTTPVDVVGLEPDIIAVQAGEKHTCALSQAGRIQCWGDNDYGQLGDGTTTGRNRPVDILTPASSALGVGIYHTCAVAEGGGLKCWGNNDWGGQLGTGDFTSRSSPVDVVGFNGGAVAVAAGYYHTCAIADDMGAQCWGRNDDLQLGDKGSDSVQLKPVPVADLDKGVAMLAAGANHTCAISNGGVKCWGDNDWGQLGDGSSRERGNVTQVAGMTQDVLSIDAGHDHTCAVTASFQVKCWGLNGRGQLGDGSTETRAVPVEVTGLEEAH
ncbi:MAG: chromosome condensation regulator RCC1 [Chloroflexi bacterium]|nr:chromosome condensation regulator RCC1 [Chloroflexota bacterium]